MITLILGDSKFPNLIIESLKRKKKIFLLLISQKKIFLKRKKILLDLVLENSDQ